MPSSRVDRRWQVVRLELSPAGSNDQAFCQILQLANVPRPAVARQAGEHIPRQLRRPYLILLAEDRQKMAHQRLNVLWPITQRWYQQMNDIEAVEQVLPKGATCDLIQQYAVRRRHNPHVHRRRTTFRTNSVDIAILKKPEEERLHPQTHLTDLVEEHRATVSLLKQTRLVAVRSGKTASYVSEQL